MAELFRGIPLLPVGATVPVADGATLLKGKAVLLLFSSVWCPDCKPFCGITKQFLAKLRANAKCGDVEVVWVSSDRSAEAAAKYWAAQHEWPMVPFDCAFRDDLKRKYGFCASAEKEAIKVVERKGGIPTLALISDDGTLLATHTEANMASDAIKEMQRMHPTDATAEEDQEDNPHVESNKIKVNCLSCEGAFGGLTDRERLYAFHIGKAAWEGAKICLVQTSPEAPLIFELLQRTFAGCDADPTVIADLGSAATSAGVSDCAFRAFLVYCACFFNNMGNYRSFGDTKIIPGNGCTPDVFASIVRLSAAYKGGGAQQAAIDDLLSATLDRVFSLGPREKELAMSPGGISTYYSADVTKGEAAAVQKWLDRENISPYNTRLFKTAPGEFELRTASADANTNRGAVEFEGMKITVTSGDHGPLMARAASHLQQAIAHAANDEQRAMLAKYVEAFTTGDMQAHIDGSRLWIKDKGPAVESYIGFIESYQDPFGVRGEWEGFVAVVNRAVSAKFQVLVDAAPRLLPLLPWGASFEKDKFLRPDFTSLEVVSFGSSGIPAGINIPNYDSVRQNDGFKNVSLGNVLACRMKPQPGDVTSFLRGNDQSLYQNLVGPAFEVQVGLHELLGHGSGKLFMSADDAKGVVDPITAKPVASWYGPGETWDTKFPGFGSSYEECRAECVGIYLCVNDNVLDIFGHGKGAEQAGADVMYINWLNMVRAGVLALQYYSPETKKWGQAHMQARYVILQVLLEAGGGLVEIVDVDPDASESPSSDSTCILLDRSKIETVGVKAIGAFLTRLQVYKATADFPAGKAMYDKYSTVDTRFETLRDEVVRRRKPRSLWVQANLAKSEDGKKVELTMFPPTVEGVLQSFARRYPAEDPELMKLANKDAHFHKY